MKCTGYLFVLFLLVVSCKHSTDHEFDFSVEATYLITGDSVALNTRYADGEVQFSLNPQIGKITTAGYYMAPFSLLKDSTPLWITATDGRNSVSKGLIIVKRSKQDTPVSFKQTIMPLLEGNCNFKGCHGNGSRAGKVSLEGYDSVIAFVIRYQPTRSLLYQSLIKTDPLRRMPPAGPLHAYKIGHVYAWIEEGAVRD